MRPTKVCENPACGKVFERKPKTSNKQWERRRVCSLRCSAFVCSNSQGRFDEAALRALVAERLTLSQIARRMGFSSQAISARLKKMGLKDQVRPRRNCLPPGFFARSMKATGPVETVAEFLARKGEITRCPTKFCAPTEHGALSDGEAAERIEAMPLPENGTASWKRGVSA